MSNNIEEYDFAKEFTEYPGPRYISLGDHSGELFRVKVLKEYFDNNKPIKLDIEGTLVAFGPSFLSEAFGGVAVKYGLSKFNEIVHVKEDTEKNRRFKEKMMDYVKMELAKK